jgi:hypothetical protein
MALGSRLRRLSGQMTEQAAALYDLYQVDLQPKWFPVFYSLSGKAEITITDLARGADIFLWPYTKMSRWAPAL